MNDAECQGCGFDRTFKRRPLRPEDRCPPCNRWMQAWVRKELAHPPTDPMVQTIAGDYVPAVVTVEWRQKRSDLPSGVAYRVRREPVPLPDDEPELTDLLDTP